MKVSIYRLIRFYRKNLLNSSKSLLLILRNFYFVELHLVIIQSGIIYLPLLSSGYLRCKKALCSCKNSLCISYPIFQDDLDFA